MQRLSRQVFEELSYYTAEKKAQPKRVIWVAHFKSRSGKSEKSDDEERKQNGSLNQSPKRKGKVSPQPAMCHDSLSETQDCTCRLYSLIQREEK